MKTMLMPLALVALTACQGSEAADDKRFQKHTVAMSCGTANYTLTSSCIKSKDPMQLNECKPQSLVIDSAGKTLTRTLPELSRSETARIKASGGDLEDLFVVAWACNNATDTPIAALRYSIGGGSAAYAESWSFYDKSGILIENDRKITPGQVEAIRRNFKKIPSIMPE